MGYAGSAGLEPQQFVSNNQPCGYICYGFGEFDGQGSGHDFSGNVRTPFCLVWYCILMRVHALLVSATGELAYSNHLLQDWHPAFGFVNNCDGSRSHSYCDYRQQ
jgi:hypothetical protein